MGKRKPVIKSDFIYKDIEQALHYAVQYSDMLISYNNKFTYEILSDGQNWMVSFKIEDNGGDNNRRNIKRIGN